jgi:hypothetical protein
MPTLHRTIEDAVVEAKELITRYNLKHVYIVKSDRIYNNFSDPGYEALTGKELGIHATIVQLVGRDRNQIY